MSYKRFLISTVYLASSGCAPYELGINTIEPPVLRDAPSRKIKVVGSKPADFEINMSIRFVTSNDKCKEPVNIPMGAYSGGSHYVVGATKATRTEYEVELLIDAVEPGWCQWRPFTINYHVKKSDADQLMPAPPAAFAWFTMDGVQSLPHFEVECEQGSNPVKPARRSLFCTQPLGKYFLLESATVLNVSFVERAWRGRPLKKLGN